MKKTVLLFACIEKNIGDDLFVWLLCNRYPHINFIITEDAKYGMLEKIPNLLFSSELKKWMWASNVGENNIIKRGIAILIESFYKYKIGKHKMAISIVGNAFKNYDYKGWSQSRWIRDRISLVDKFYLISTNFGPYFDNGWKLDFMKIFPKMEDICFRDIQSYSLFNELPNVRYAPDAVLSLGKKKRSLKKKKQIIISVIDCSFSARDESLKKSTINYENCMANVIDYYISQGYRIVLLNSNSIQDSPASSRIMIKCKNNEKIEIVNYNGDFSDIESIFEDSEMVIGTRLHTIILSWLYDLPIIPIIYDIKVKNILLSYGFKGVCYNITNLEDITIQNFIEAFENYSFSLSEKIIQESENQFKVLDKVLIKE